MMVGACLVPLMTLVLALSPDASALVARLGSGTPAERAESARALEAMGREALPALEAALSSPDAEVRSRVLSVWERIQKGLMARPTMIRFEGGRRTLTEVFRSIGKQGGFALEFTPHGEEEPDIDARDLGPTPFWQAIDRLGQGFHFHQVLPHGRHFPVVEFGNGHVAYPSTISGPFRITLEGLHDHRDRTLIAGPWLRLDEINQRIPIPRTVREHEARFYIDLGMMIEPRMWFSQEGPARAIEAVDDLGQSLVRRETTRVEADYSIFRNGSGVAEGHFQLDLAMPEKPGRSIALLRASVPVAIQVRSPVPAFEIPLPAAVGKTFAHEDALFTLQQFQESDRGTRIDLGVRINRDRFELPAGADGALVSARLGCLVGHQVEIADADGRVLAEPGGSNCGQDGNARLGFVVWKNETNARPVRIRYYRMVRAFTDVAFEFRNIPMP